MNKEHRKEFTKEEAAKVLEDMGLTEQYDANEFFMGINVELEHGKVNESTNLTNDDPILTAKIALAHLNEIDDYYTRLKIMEDEAKKEKTNKESSVKDLDKIVHEAVRNADSVNEKIEVIVQKRVEAFYPINGAKFMASGVITYEGRTFPWFVKWSDKKDLECPQELYESMIRSGYKNWNALEAFKELKKAVLKAKSEDESELDEAKENEEAEKNWQSEKTPGKAPDPRTDEISGKGRTDGTDIKTDKLVKEWEKKSSKVDIDKIIESALNKTATSKRDITEAITECSRARNELQSSYKSISNVQKKVNDAVRAAISAGANKSDANTLAKLMVNIIDNLETMADKLDVLNVNLKDTLKNFKE